MKIKYLKKLKDHPKIGVREIEGVTEEEIRAVDKYANLNDRNRTN